MTKKEFKAIDMTAKFSKFQVINKDFTRCRCNVFYTGRNRNYSDITEEALQKFIDRKGYANVPVVAHLMKDDNGNYYVGSHDSKLVWDSNGIEIVNECVPFGVIPTDCNPSMDLITEKSGEQRKYFSVDIILWTHRYPIMEAAYNDEIYFNQSMEVNFEDYTYNGDYVVVNEFSMSALCLLNKRDSSGTDGNNKNQEPCFESSRVKAFSIDTDKFKHNFELMLEKIKQYESDGTTATVQNNITNKPNKEEKNFMDLKKFAEILAEPKNYESDVCKYKLLNVTDSKVYVLDIEDYKPYGFDYAITTENDVENIVIDFNSKVEMSLSATEKITEDGFEEFSIQSEIDSVKDEIFTKDIPEKVDECTKLLKAEYEKEIENLGVSFKTLNEQFENISKELEQYKAKENIEKANQHKADVDALFEKYAPRLNKCAEFLVYKAKTKPADVTVEEVNEKLTLMLGKYTLDNQRNKNFAYNPTEAGVGGRKNETITNKYGHLLDKYIK